VVLISEVGEPGREFAKSCGTGDIDGEDAGFKKRGYLVL